MPAQAGHFDEDELELVGTSYRLRRDTMPNAASMDASRASSSRVQAPDGQNLPIDSNRAIGSDGRIVYTLPTSVPLASAYALQRGATHHRNGERKHGSIRHSRRDRGLVVNDAPPVSTEIARSAVVHATDTLVMLALVTVPLPDVTTQDCAGLPGCVCTVTA